MLPDLVLSFEVAFLLKLVLGQYLLKEALLINFKVFIFITFTLYDPNSITVRSVSLNWTHLILLLVGKSAGSSTLL
jgi:hypothetical protein